MNWSHWNKRSILKWLRENITQLPEADVGTPKRVPNNACQREFHLCNGYMPCTIVKVALHQWSMVCKIETSSRNPRLESFQAHYLQNLQYIRPDQAYYDWIKEFPNFCLKKLLWCFSGIGLQEANILNVSVSGYFSLLRNLHLFGITQNLIALWHDRKSEGYGMGVVHILLVIFQFII